MAYRWPQDVASSAYLLRLSRVICFPIIDSCEKWLSEFSRSAVTCCDRASDQTASLFAVCARRSVAMHCASLLLSLVASLVTINDAVRVANCGKCMSEIRTVSYV